MKATISISVLAMMACACGSAASPDAGSPVTDSRYFSVEAIALAPASQVYALGQNLIDEHYQIRIIDPMSRSVSRTISLAKPHPGAHDLRVGRNGRLYFLQNGVVGAGTNGEGGELRAQLWCVDSTWGEEFIVDQSATGEGGSYALSPDGKMVAFGDRVEPIYAHTGHQIGTEIPPRPMVFSSDATQLLDTSRGPRLVAVGPDGTQSIDAASSPVQIKGDDVLLARLDDARFQALTKKDGQLYLEDLNAHTSAPLWKYDLSTYAWADATHLFEVADPQCTEGGGLGGEPCHRTAFTLRYRSITDVNDVKDVAQVDARGWTDAVLLPDAKHFVWAVDGTLRVQAL